MNRTLGPIRRRNGIAGQYAYDVTVTYTGLGYDPAGKSLDHSHRVSFVGSAYGAPVVVVSRFGPNDAEEWQIVVDDWTRYGATLNPEWIRRFYDDAEGA